MLQPGAGLVPAAATTRHGRGGATTFFFGHERLKDLIGRRSLRDKEDGKRKRRDQLYKGLCETASLRTGAGQ